MDLQPLAVIPVKTGIQEFLGRTWTPACAGADELMMKLPTIHNY